MIGSSRRRAVPAAVLAVVVLAAASLIPGRAPAQDLPSSAAAAEVRGQGPAYEGPEDFTVLAEVGLMGGLAPDYPGSDDYEVIPVPYLNASYHNAVFLRGRRLGANAVYLGSRREGFAFRAGPVARLDLGRDTDANDALEGLDDVDPGAEVGGFAELAYLVAALKLEVRQEVAGGHGGLLVDLEADASLPLTGWLRVDLGVGTAWAGDDYVDSYFGISPSQARASDLPTFEPDSGINSVSATLGASYFLSESWLIRAQGYYARLLGDAADSPIVDDRGSPNQFFVGLGAAYRFAY